MSVGTETATKNTTTAPTINPADIIVSSGDLSNLEKVKSEYNATPTYTDMRCNGSVKTTVESCTDDKSVIYSGTTPFVPSVSSKIYFNGYEVVLTNGDANKGNGILYFPLFGSRMAVEWKRPLTIVKGEGDFGCVVGINDQIQAVGSDPTVLSDDLNKQFTALAAWLNTPGSFTGTFGDALAEAKKVASNLLDKIANSKPVIPDDYKKYNNVCKAIDKGIDAWKKEIEKEYGTTSEIPQIKTLLANLDNYKTELKAHLDCDGTGSILRKLSLEENPILYASLINEFQTFEFEQFLVVSKCQLSATATLADKVLKELDGYDDLKYNSPINSFESYRELDNKQIEFKGFPPGFLIWTPSTLPFEIAEETEALRIIHKDWSDSRLLLTAAWNVYKEKLHTLLDVAGLVPLIGELADGTNAVIYAAEGDYTNASFSAISMIPVIGDAAGKGSKYTMKVSKYFTIGKRFFLSPARGAAYKLLLKYGDDVADAIWDARNSKLIRGVIEKAGLALKVTWQAHHMIPKELIEEYPLLRKAIDEGFKFNDLDNLIPLDNLRHLGSHGTYTTEVRRLIDNFSNRYKSKSAKEIMDLVANKIKTTINSTTGDIDELILLP